MPRVLPADFPNDATLRMSALNVFRMLIPAFRSAGASGAVISEYRSGTGLTDLYLADLINREKYEIEYTALKEKLNVPPEPKLIDEALVMSLIDAYDKLPPSGKKEAWNRFIRRIVIANNGDIFFDLV